ncbi:MAG: DUF2125 domain-containing protein [Pseudomonadota bacterium]
MRLILWIVGVLAFLWGGYWFVGAATLERSTVAWLEDRRADGWVADYDSVVTRGFPSRFDTTLNGLDIADPDTGVAWQAPFFQILSLSYKPNHVTAVWPGEQVFSTPLQSIDISSSYMQGSMVFEPNTDLALQRTQIVMNDLALVSSEGWTSALAEGRLAVWQSEADPLVYDIGFEALEFEPAGPILDLLASGSDLPDTISQLYLDTEAAFDEPWDRHAIEDARPQPTAIDLRLLRATWGEMDLQMTGQVLVDEQGYPDGEVSVQAKNWRDMLALAVRAGALSDDLRPTVERALEILAGLTGNPDAIDAKVGFRNGSVTFGPFPIGPAPRLVIR